LHPYCNERWNVHLIIMNKILKLINKPIFTCIVLMVAITANAQPGCLKVDSIAKWEVLDGSKTIVYDSQGNSIAFIIFEIIQPYEYLSKSNETFRFFSSMICRNDRVQTSKVMTRISSIEPIRK
jgi:hypothetical protein